ncbi:hypothetical protein [Phenylobacterium ferrooxidans]|uniref:Uncharacterized protein n=1 Tax=Phenylobacterium ferrooxidans TaxID=2982689 RepID=A0ABW6CJV4_9CAUL
MDSLDTARQGKSAARQIRAQINSNTLTPGELDRLLRKVEAGYEVLLPAPLPPMEVEALARRSAFTVTRGGKE